MHAKIIGLVFVLGALLALGIDTSQLAVLALVILMFVCSFSLILRGKWLPQFGGSLIALLIGPCLVAVILRILFAQLKLPFLTGVSLGLRGIFGLLFVVCLVAIISFFVVKRRLSFLQQDLPPSPNERQAVYSPRRRKFPEK